MKVKINIDGGSRGNPGPGASAYVIKNPEGKLLAQEGHFLAHCTNNHAEFTALKRAAQACLLLGATELDIRSDSLLLVKQYLGEYKIKNQNLKELIDQIRQITENFKAVHIQHVPREQNKEADALANKAMDAKCDVGCPPAADKQTAPAAQAAPAPTNTPKTKINSAPAAPARQSAAIKTAQPKTRKTGQKKASKPKKGPQQLDLFDGF